MAGAARAASTQAAVSCVSAWRRLRSFALGMAAAAMFSLAAAEPVVEVLRQAERTDANGLTSTVTLPDTVELAPGEPPPLRRSYRWRLFLQVPPNGHALYLPGLFAHSVISVNGHVLKDGSARNDQQLPRSVDRLVLLNVPDAFWQAGENTIELQAVGLKLVAVSALQFGPAAELAARQRNRVLVVVILPAVVAAVVATLGLCLDRKRHV